MPATIQLPLDLPDVEVLSTESRPGGALIIRVESTLKTTRCRVCGQEIDRFHGHDKAIELHHLPILDREVYIRIEPKRYRCPNCEGGPTTTQRCEWYEPNSRRTKAYEHWVLRYLVNTTVSDTSRTLGLGNSGDSISNCGIVTRKPLGASDFIEQLEKILARPLKPLKPRP